MPYSKSIDCPSCSLVRGRDAPCIGHQSITGYSILWNGIFSNRVWLSSAWNRDTDLSEPVLRTPCSEYKYHCCFKWTKAHSSCSQSDIPLFTVRSQNGASEDYAVRNVWLCFIDPAHSGDVVSAVALYTYSLDISLSPLSYLLHLLSVHRLWVENPKRDADAWGVGSILDPWTTLWCVEACMFSRDPSERTYIGLGKGFTTEYRNKLHAEEQLGHWMSLKLLRLIQTKNFIWWMSGEFKWS